jgi:hypothetical protein
MWIGDLQEELKTRRVCDVDWDLQEDLAFNAVCDADWDFASL